MTNQINTKLLERVRKLLALSKGNANVNEAAAAAAAAQRLIFEHSITPEQLEASADPLFEGAVYTVKGKQMQAWRHTLATCLARSNDCRSYRCGNQLNVFGTELQIQTVRYMFEYLDRTIQELADGSLEVKLADNTKTARSSFCKGAVYVIAKRLHEQYQAQRRQVETSNSAALVIINNKLARLDDELERKRPGLRPATIVPPKDDEARAAGERAGARIALDNAGTLGQSSSADRMLGA